MVICACGCSDIPQTDVDRLASSNLRTMGTFDEELPASWSEVENERAWKAYAKLVENGKDGLPLLITGLDRREFSTYKTTAVWYAPQTVGDQCRMAAAEMFDPINIMYKSRKNAAGERILCCTYFGDVFRTRRDGEKWWEQNQHHTEDEIKEMIRAWYVNRETTIGFENSEQKAWMLEEIDRRFHRGTDQESVD